MKLHPRTVRDLRLQAVAVLAAAGVAVLTAVTVVALLVAAQNSDSQVTSPSSEDTSASGVISTTSSVRPPLDDPPDPGPVPDNHGIDADDLAAVVRSSVRISGFSCNLLREGSGFAVGSQDLIATNAHVMLGVKEPTVVMADGRELPGTLVAFDEVNDLAVLKVEGAGLDPLPLRATAADGTIGAVLGWSEVDQLGPEPQPSPFRIDRPVTVRTRSVASEVDIERPSWLVAARIESGHSGAALVAYDSDEPVVVGVAWGASRRTQTRVGYATRAGQLEKLLPEAQRGIPFDPPDCR